MRLLLVSHARNNPDAGASRVYHLLTDGLTQRGHTVRCLHYEDFHLSGFRERVLPRLAFPHAASKAAKTYLHEGFDVVMSSSGMLYPLFERLRSTKDRPLLVNHLHGLAYFDHHAILDEVSRSHMKVSTVYKTLTGPLQVRWDAKGSEYADLTIAQNLRDIDFLEDQGITQLANIPLPVHPSIHRAGQDRAPQSGRDPLNILWFGSWVERKGAFYLPRAFEKIVDRYPAVRLTIGGTGYPAERILPAFAANVRANITVLGRISVDEHIKQLNKNSILLFPSLSEGFGFSTLEALSMGMAVVTTHTGLGGDFLKDRQNARVIPMSSAVHLADAVVELIGNPELRSHIADNGQKLAQRFSTERFIADYEETLSTALAAHERMIPA